MAVLPQIIISDVTKIVRPGVGPVYRAVVPMSTVYEMLRDGYIKYSPKYQRGFQPGVVDSKSAGDFEELLPFDNSEIQVKESRSAEIAVKYLLGSSNRRIGGAIKALYSADLTWNARRDEDRPAPTYDEDTRELSVRSMITVPDSAHRHRAYYLLGRWLAHPSDVPARVDVDGTGVPRSDILDLLDQVDLSDESVHSTFVTIYNLDAEREGYLYDEFNSDAKPPAGAKAIALNPEKTPSRRFVQRLMLTSSVFEAPEIETERNSIGSKSRKLTTNATLVAAADQQKKLLEKLELDGQEHRYDDLVDFVAEFFEEWASHFPAFLPGQSADFRHRFRSESYALSNIMFHPLFEFAFEIWSKHDAAGSNWRANDGWRDAIARIAGTTNERDDETGEHVETDVMSKLNPAWRGRIQVKTLNKDGTVGWSLSSTRQTRIAAYDYLARIAGIKEDR